MKTIRVNRLQKRILLEWLASAQRADKDAYSDGMFVYDPFPMSEVNKSYRDLKKQLRARSPSGK